MSTAIYAMTKLHQGSPVSTSGRARRPFYLLVLLIGTNINDNERKYGNGFHCLRIDGRPVVGGCYVLGPPFMHNGIVVPETF